MLINGITFLIMVSCYTKMYCSIRSSHAWNTNDSRIAKRMALLVFSDFFCWAPICFFSLTAAFGHELISLNGAKVMTIFLLPLNSCANPFLYAIFTKQFKKDCQHVCRRIDETIAVSRNLSRGSNRTVNAPIESSRILIGLQEFFRIEKRNVPNMVTSENVAADAVLPLNISDGLSVHYSRQLEIPSSGNDSRNDMNSDASRSRRSVQFCENTHDSKNGSGSSQRTLKVGNDLLPNGILLHANKNSTTNLDTRVISKDNLNSPKKTWRFPWRTCTGKKSMRPHPSLTCSQSQTSSPVTMKHTPFHSISLNFLNRSPVTSPHRLKDTAPEKSSQNTSHRKQSNFSDTEQSTDMLELCDCSEDGCNSMHDDTCSVASVLGLPQNSDDNRMEPVADNSKLVVDSAITEHDKLLRLTNNSRPINSIDNRHDNLTCHSEPVSRSDQSDGEVSPCWHDSDIAEEVTRANSHPYKHSSTLVAEGSPSKGPVAFQLNGNAGQSLVLLQSQQHNGNCRRITDDIMVDQCEDHNV